MEDARMEPSIAFDDALRKSPECKVVFKSSESIRDEIVIDTNRLNHVAPLAMRCAVMGKQRPHR